MTDLDEKTAAALARLDAREDPPPPPVLPPQEVRTVYDGRLVVEQVIETGRQPQLRWRVLHGTAEVDPAAGLGDMIARAASIVAQSGAQNGGWHPLFYRACRHVLDALGQIGRTMPRQEKEKAS